MRHALDRYREANEAHDSDAFTQADLDFHSCLVQATQNDILPIMLQPIADMLRAIRVTVGHGEALRPTAVADHRAIYAAIESRDGKAAAKAMEKHLQTVRRQIDMADNTGLSTIPSLGSDSSAVADEGGGETKNSSVKGRSEPAGNALAIKERFS